MDWINGTLEFLGGCFVLFSVRAVLRDKSVTGVSWVHVSFFSGWGLWNLIYYPSLDQWWSFSGGCWLVLVNTVYVALLLKYRNKG